MHNTSILFICKYLFVLCLCVYVCLHVCLFIKWIPDAQGGQKRASEPMKLKLKKVEKVVSSHVDAGY